MSKNRTKVYPIQPTVKTEQAAERPQVSAAPEGPQNGRRNAFVIGTLMSVLLLVLLLTAALMLISGLYTPYEHNYINEAPLSPLSSEACALANERINEAEAPMELYDPNIPLFYDFTLSVPRSYDVGNAYFNNTVFIGDSRIKGLLMYTDLSPIDFSGEGANVSSVQTKSYIRMKDKNGEIKNYTLVNALKQKQGEYSSVYISLGLNELGWKLDQFTSTFRALISSIREISDVHIYVQLIMPITTKAEAASKFGITNAKAALFNEALTEMTSELKLFRLDPLSLFILEDGTLDPRYASDGIHLYPESYKTLAEYYRTHVVDLERYANTRSVDPIEAPPTVVVSIGTVSPVA